MARIHNRQSTFCRAWATGDKNEQTIWNILGYDFNVRTRKALLEKLDYCYKKLLTIIVSPTSKESVDLVGTDRAKMIGSHQANRIAGRRGR